MSRRKSCAAATRAATQAAATQAAAPADVAAPAPTSAAPAPSPAAADAPSTGVPTPPVDQVSPGASPPAPGETDQRGAAQVPPLGGLEALGLLDVPPAERPQPADLDLRAFVRALIEGAAGALGLTYDQVTSAVVIAPGSDALAGDAADDASAARTRLPPSADISLEEVLAQVRPMAMAGIPVLFREKSRRFNGAPTTPAIITRVLDAGVVNLMVLPDGDTPYPRLNVPYEPDLDPDGLGRAWTHLKLPDD